MTARGDDLKSLYWRDLLSTILPHHRAIYGLNYHGSNGVTNTVVQTIHRLGCGVDETDKTGNTALHTAISTCRSRWDITLISVMSIFDTTDINICFNIWPVSIFDISTCQTSVTYVVFNCVVWCMVPMLATELIIMHHSSIIYYSLLLSKFSSDPQMTRTIDSLSTLHIISHWTIYHVIYDDTFLSFILGLQQLAVYGRLSSLSGCVTIIAEQGRRHISSSSR